jgi:hypothetical protein
VGAFLKDISKILKILIYYEKREITISELGLAATWPHTERLLDSPVMLKPFSLSPHPRLCLQTPARILPFDELPRTIHLFSFIVF